MSVVFGTTSRRSWWISTLSGSTRNHFWILAKVREAWEYLAAVEMSLTTSLGRKSWSTQVKGKYEDRARREEQSRRDISEKEKERMSRHNDMKKHDERIRNESSEKEKVKQDTVRHEGGLATVARRED